MINKLEAEIIQNWQGDIAKPLVSICCSTYNHESYINEALDSFLMQETDFPFEIIVRDDASTDNTANVIREYEKKFPSIIKPIYESENGFQKGIKPLATTMKHARGTYIAVCEGDDYWTDPNKLQLQIQKLKEHPQIKLSFHSAVICSKDRIRRVIARRKKHDEIFPINKLILGDGGFCPTASLILKKEVLSDLPQWYYDNAPVGDYYLQVIAAFPFGALYIDRVMSAYREHNSNWTASQVICKNRLLFIDKNVRSLKQMNAFFKFVYNREIKVMIKKNYFWFCICSKYPLLERRKQFQQHIKLFNFIDKILIKIALDCPRFFIFLKLVKGLVF